MSLFDVRISKEFKGKFVKISSPFIQEWLALKQYS